MWETDTEECNEFEEFPEEIILEEQDTQSNKYKTLIQWLLMFLFGFQAFYHLTDRAIEVLYRFLKAFLEVLGHLFSPELSRAFPASMSKSRMILGYTTKFRRYVTCKRCYCVYLMADCLETRGSRQVTKTCSHIIMGKKTMCNNVLLKTVELASKKKIFHPLMTYCYVDLRTSLQILLHRNQFIGNCQEWKSRSASDDTLSDIYDGRVWKKFQNKGFFNDNYSFGLMLNCDWFQPYKHLQYSIGVIYLTVLNLPYSMRNKIQNVILVGILPGPHEPRRNINSFIDPLVTDLMSFWEGVELNVGSNVRKVVKCAIICVSCDIPAGRKLCGFLGHTARLGCSKCYKVFSGSIGNKDYSGFNRDSWTTRTETKHRMDVERISLCSTVTARNKLESTLGCRYSALLKLPYFDPPVMLAVDPMHNLFLGIAKHHLKRMWISTGLLDDHKFKSIQDRIDNFLVPPDIGRIPSKIQSGFSSFTAEQFKNWVNHFSIIALRDMLPSNDLECWRHFVLACRILCLKTLTVTQVKLADALLLQYCKRVERMYGTEVVTPNMHYSCHVCSCVFDFGPSHSFWLFSFERFNGILGKLPNNNRSVEVQMMRRFQSDIQATSFPCPDMFQDNFQHLLPYKSDVHLNQKLSTTAPNYWSFEALESCLHLPSAYHIGSLSLIAVDQLKNLYSAIYSKPIADICVCSTFHKYLTVKLGSNSIGSHKSRSHTSSILMAQWNSSFFGLNSGTEIRPLQINYFAKHSVSIGACTHTHLLVFVKWFSHHPKKSVCGKPVTVWEHELFDIEHFIPFQLLRFRTVSVIDKLSDSDGHVLFVSPLLDTLFE